MERNARAHFRVVRINRWTVAVFLMIALAILLFPVGKLRPASGTGSARVQPGVKLGGRDFSGMTEHEAKSALRQMAPTLSVEPEPAREFAESAGVTYVVPEVNGYALDVDATWYKLVTARPGSRVNPVTRVDLPPSRMSDYPQSVIKRGNAAKQAVGLLVNVDWGREELKAMLPILDRHGAKVTVFVSGRFAGQNGDIIAEVAAKGHEVASHGHDLSTGPKALAAAGKLKADIARSVSTIETVTHTKVHYWAPHMNELDAEILKTAGDLQLRTVLSSLDPRDWDQTQPPERILATIKQATAGDLILLHPRPNTVQILDQALQYLNDRGLKPLTLSDLLSPQPTSAKR